MHELSRLSERMLEGEESEMTRDEAIKRIEEHIRIHGADEGFRARNIQEALNMAINALKTQGLVTIEPKQIELQDETKAWLDEMDAVDALGNIANICIDWDGYRTADDLGGLINEIWAYAKYCCNKIMKEQEPRLVTEADFDGADEYGYLPVWVEDKDDSEIICDCITKAAITDPDEHYHYRYWTSRPTDAQREAVKWNG